VLIRRASFYICRAQAVTFGVDCTCSFSFQEKVACLADNDARLALDPNDKYKIQVDNFHTRSITLYLKHT